MYLNLVNRLRGIYTMKVDESVGPLNGKDTFTRTFEGLPAINGFAADALERLATWVHQNPDAPDELHDFAAKVLGQPSLAHGFDNLTEIREE